MLVQERTFDETAACTATICELESAGFVGFHPNMRRLITDAIV
jgi:hypothetical protein